MNDLSLQSSMKLIALVSNYCDEESYPLFKKIAEKFTLQLNETLNLAQSQSYFDFYYKQLCKRDFTSNRKRNSVLSVKLLTTTTRLVAEMDQIERQLLSLLIFDVVNDFDSRGRKIEIATTVASMLEIMDADINRFRLFTSSGSFSLTAKKGFLIADGLPSVFENHLFYENMTGNIVFVQSEETKEIFFKVGMSEDVFYLNECPVEPNIPYRYPWGCIISSPKIGSIYYSDIYQSFLNLGSKYLIVNNLKVSSKDGEINLHPFRLSARSGECIGVIGSPGSGKSLAIRSIAGEVHLETGSSKYDDFQLIQKNIDKLGNKIGVLNNSFLLPDLTIRQYLTLFLRLKKPSLLKEEINTRIQSVFEYIFSVNKPDNFLEIRIKDVHSKSQQFAIKVCRELLRESELLFADDVFFCLSPSESRDVCRTIKKLTAKGCIVVLGSGRPTFPEFKTFDKVLVLDKSYPVYWGAAASAFGYFRKQTGVSVSSGNVFLSDKEYNPDELIELIERNEPATSSRKIKPEEWYDLFLDYCQENEPVLQNNKKAKETTVKRSLYDSVSITLLIFRYITLRQFATPLKLFYNLLMAPLACVLIIALLDGTETSPDFQFHSLLLAGFVLYGSISGYWISFQLLDLEKEIGKIYLLKQYKKQVSIGISLICFLSVLAQLSLILVVVNTLMGPALITHFVFFSVFVMVSIILVRQFMEKHLS
jgi:ABC-type multidrug transport system ATPase subunit